MQQTISHNSRPAFLSNAWDKSMQKKLVRTFLIYLVNRQTALVYKDSSMHGRKQKKVLNYPGHYLSETVVEKAAF